MGEFDGDGSVHIKRKDLQIVTASKDLLDAAIAINADAILVHHGYFWRGEDPRIIGIKQQRLKQLLINDVNLLAYHLPIDAHPIYGNNAQLAGLINIEIKLIKTTPFII